MNHYDRTLATEYDLLALRTIPDGQRFYETVAEALPEASRQVLELGCGTGILTARIRDERPSTAVTCIDRSPAMLAIARGKPGMEDVTFVEGDIRGPWPGGPQAIRPGRRKG